jgi:hypothetical protein
MKTYVEEKLREKRTNKNDLEGSEQKKLKQEP